MDNHPYHFPTWTWDGMGSDLGPASSLQKWPYHDCWRTLWNEELAYLAFGKVAVVMGIILCRKKIIPCHAYIYASQEPGQEIDPHYFTTLSSDKRLRMHRLCLIFFSYREYCILIIYNSSAVCTHFTFQPLSSQSNRAYWTEKKRWWYV
jgi:hypothetical protein